MLFVCGHGLLETLILLLHFGSEELKSCASLGSFADRIGRLSCNPALLRSVAKQQLVGCSVAAA